MASNIYLYNQDCMEGMVNCPDKFYDLAIVDVPYGISMMDSDNKSRGVLTFSKDYKIIDDSNSPSLEYFSQLNRLSKNQIIWGANHFISKIPYNSPCWVVWDKDNGENDFADCELAYTSFRSAVRKFKYRWQGMLQEVMSHKEIRIHPTQKPVALYKWLLKKYAKPGDKILDTHLGSGSIAIACYDMGHDLTGYEIDEDYYNAAVKRLQNHKKQITFL